MNPAQQAEIDRLMTIPISTWPESLIQHVRSKRGPFCGDALIAAVAEWVQAGRTMKLLTDAQFEQIKQELHRRWTADAAADAAAAYRARIAELRQGQEDQQ